MTRIVGICLFRNEEFYLERAIRNVAGFCDDLILVDNLSDDFSAQVASQLARDLPHVTLLTVQTPHRTQRLISHLAGTPTWVLGIDGDEIYDPEGLARLRPRILAGEFDSHFQIRGHSLHCTALDPTSFHIATGYPTPGARTATKLYNFARLHAWRGIAQRLHGWDIIYRGRTRYMDAALVHDEGPIESVDFRMLHLCFLPRSRMDLRNPEAEKRANPSETKRKLDYKRATYAVGEPVSLPIGAFFPPLDSLPVSPTDRREPDGLAACRLPAPDWREPAHAAQAAALRELYAAGRAYDLVCLGATTGTHQTGRHEFHPSQVLHVELTPRGATLPVVQDGFEALLVEVSLFPMEAEAEPGGELDIRQRASTQFVQIPFDTLEAGRAHRFELPLDVRALEGRPGIATLDLAVPYLMRLRKDRAKHLRVPIEGVPAPISA